LLEQHPRAVTYVLKHVDKSFAKFLERSLFFVLCSLYFVL
jgi:hypothetical protein